MTTGASDLTLARGLDRGLLWTTCLSALVHGFLLGAALLLPAYFLSASPRIESYTVDLVAPDVLGGTNLNSRGGTSAPPLTAVPQVAAKRPAQAGMSIADARSVIPEAPAPKPAEKAAPAAKVNPGPEPLKRNAEEKAPSAASAKPLAAEGPAAPPVAVKAPPAPPKPKPLEESKPKPKAVVPAAAKLPPAKPSDEAAKKSKQVRAAAPPAKAVAAAPAASNSTKGPSQASTRKVAANPARTNVPNVPTPKVAEPKGTADRDRAIAAAVQRRAAESASKAKTKSAVDQRIAAAVQRRAAQVGAGAGKPLSAAGGPVSSGPGDAVGGRQADLEYVLYQGRMEERVKQAWAWAGADPSLRATVQFNIMPDGEIRNVRTIKASGDTSYDASVERAVRAVSPLDPPPERLREDFALVELTFQPEQGR